MFEQKPLTAMMTKRSVNTGHYTARQGIKTPKVMLGSEFLRTRNSCRDKGYAAKSPSPSQLSAEKNKTRNDFGCIVNIFNTTAAQQMKTTHSPDQISKIKP